MSVILPALLAVLSPGCGSGDRDEPAGSSPVQAPAYYSEPVDVTGFTFVQSPPDTVRIGWTGEGSGLVREVTVSEGDEAMVGDTLAMVMEDIGTVIAERLRMELEIASARLLALPSDSMLVQRVDSLSRLLDSLESHSARPLLSPLAGRITGVLESPGNRIYPGSIMMEVAVESSRLFLVRPPEGCSMSGWPMGGDSVRLVEERTDHAVYSGDLSELESLFGRLEAVERVAVFESDLSSYVVSEDDDTIPVQRVGEYGRGLVMLLPVRPLPRRLATWAGKTNGDHSEP
ncbi:MAG: hypothetical protein JXA64_03715 [Candidatus Fermentibacteraceae bacterium]|nr:hypothetical protein [Candidatus Fermentibacteraceae bacterium]MBN2608201.1 hypothetical protein [Candidatus Fermentibacteraceae bacterium]